MQNSNSKFSSVFVDIAIKQEPPEDEFENESKICTKCYPKIEFPSVKDKLLHDFFQHAQVTSVEDSKVDQPRVEVVMGEGDDENECEIEEFMVDNDPDEER